MLLPKPVESHASYRFADEPRSTRVGGVPVIEPVVAYFGGERAGSLLFLGVGVVAIEVAVTFWRKSGTQQAKAAAVALLVVAAIQLVVGATVFVRTPSDQARVVKAVEQRDLAHLRGGEIPRMKAVMERFAIIRWVEVALLAGGVLAVLFARRRSRLRGTGIGLAPQAAVMLLLDHLAEERGATYLAWLASL